MNKQVDGRPARVCNTVIAFWFKLLEAFAQCYKPHTAFAYHTRMDRSAKESGGRPWAQEIGSDDYRIHLSQHILVGSEAVITNALVSVQTGHDLLKQHQQALSMSIVRCQAEACGTPAKCMMLNTNVMKMKMQIEAVNRAIDHIGFAKATLKDNNVIAGPFGMERDFTKAQEDELGNYDQHVTNPPALHWWDPDDEKTWVPYGWLVKDTKGWMDYTTDATKKEHGLEHSAPWDPNNPESWVPYGWKVMDDGKWKEFASHQSKDDFCLVESPKTTPFSTVDIEEVDDDAMPIEVVP